MTETAERAAPDEADAALSFDLVSRPWVPVQRLDGTPGELSLSQVFAQAHELRRVTGDLPTQEFALLRLLLAIAHDALEGPHDLEEWGRLWADERGCFSAVGPYLDRHRGRFDLLHPRTPFFQAAALRTARDEVFSLNRIVADVPNNEPFFSSRMPAVDRLTFAEAARWVVHTHAYDTSGIKTGAVGDDRVKGGKVYPQGVGWAGMLGGVFVEGSTLRETLLLNLVAADTPGLRFGREDDRPAWRRTPYAPGVSVGPAESRPSGPRDLYTWQTRRLRLHFDRDGVHGVVLGYGDPLTPHNMHTREPMTGWRRSPAQEKKLGEALVYLPAEHSPARSAWRGVDALIAQLSGPAAGESEPARRLSPGIVSWVARLVTRGELPRRFLIRTRVVGVVWGTQQSVIDEVIDDRLAMAVVLLHQRHREHGRQAVDAVGDAEEAVKALGALADDLARAVGADPQPRVEGALDLGFGTLDDPYRRWLRALGEADDPYARRTQWQREVHRHIGALGARLLTVSGDAAWEGRMVTEKKGTVWLNSASAEGRFRRRLYKALGGPSGSQDPSAPGSCAGPASSSGPETPGAPAAPAAPPGRPGPSPVAVSAPDGDLPTSEVPA
ncbi:type I-E CRISPR-associated protein Cse1/CasA [Streptomyces xiamenensis]|uniref:type I-E CRISPR-associated protein Cse1/CasA n=1 Tax=Streptomyces xiamenensis TaxID=408015 RepID=UPI0037CD4E42